MNLYLLRHGEAEPNASSSAGRQLTETGIEEVISVARQFASTNQTVDHCFVSPALRAQQTAATFLETIPDAPAVVTVKELSASNRAIQAMDFLQKINNQYSGQNILLVSHNPVLSELLALLTAGNADNLHILDTANLACVSLDIIGLGMGTCSYILEPDHAKIPLS